MWPRTEETVCAAAPVVSLVAQPLVVRAQATDFGPELARVVHVPQVRELVADHVVEVAELVADLGDGARDEARVAQPERLGAAHLREGARHRGVRSQRARHRVGEGDARDGGWGIYAFVNYSRLINDAARSPVTSLRGDASQWFMAGGISYTF
jgi:hypothetical protein